jgi:hypothetical protein
MARNLGRKFATMSDDERRRFALEEEEGSRELPAELSFDEPRKEENMGEQFSSVREEVADPEHRDGLSAQLDDDQHERAVEETSRKSQGRETDRE